MELETDFVIVGGGIAGLRAAVGLARTRKVVLLTKAAAIESNTGYAQGGIAAALGPDDSPELHAGDTMAAGDGLCDFEAVRLLVTEGPRYVEELLGWGAGFDRAGDGRGLAFGREAAHSVRRVLHARDATGREISRVLWGRIAEHPRVTVLAHTQATDLLLCDGECGGVRFLDPQGQPGHAVAAAVLLATGGAAAVYGETTNPPVATGDGIAMAFEAGARVSDLEFVQFHPTALSLAGAPRFLLSEALRGEGARLLDRRGEPFMTRYEPEGELAPRDRVARAIVREVARAGGPVYLSLKHLPSDFVHRRFPQIAEVCGRFGLDLASDRIPVGPAAHYVMGGVWTDLSGCTSVPRLYAAGEVACTGVHGANRLASNSLLEGLVFGARAADAMAALGPSLRAGCVRPAPPAAAAAPVAEEAAPDIEAVRRAIWDLAGVTRDRDGLGRLRQLLCREQDALAAGRHDRPRRWTPWLRQAVSVVTVGELIARAALRREESRGAHFRADFPERDDVHWRRHVSDARA